MTRRLPAAVVAAGLLLAGCHHGEPAADGADTRTVTVLAAASLAVPLQGLADDYEAAHPGIDVQVSTGGSSDLVTQLADGRHADLLVTADERTMMSALDRALVTAPRAVATNTLTLVTAPGNPLKITDLATAGTHDLVVCATPVPCGAATARLAAREGVTVRSRSQEQNVTDVLAKVTSGQADAGVVYVTDAKKAGTAVTAVTLPGAAQVKNRYFAATTPDATAAGHDLFAELTGPAGRGRLAAAGFGTP